MVVSVISVAVRLALRQYAAEHGYEVTVMGNSSAATR